MAYHQMLRFVANHHSLCSDNLEKLRDQQAEEEE